MKPTDQTLLEQMRITDAEIEYRKSLLSLSAHDLSMLASIKPLIEPHLDHLIARFYDMQTDVTDIALLIGDADTLRRLQSAQRKYVTDLFSGTYDMLYVNNRLRIGLVHKRIGVEPKLYLAAVHTLKSLLVELLHEVLTDFSQCKKALSVLEKLFMFDTTLVFETYIRSLVSEIETSREKTEQYARMLETKTIQLQQLSRTDALTNLLNVRHLNEVLTTALNSAQRRNEPLTLLYLDVDDFKKINDIEGHQRGDDILRSVAKVMRSVTHLEDDCFRCGGDEFCIILPNCLQEQAERLLQKRFIDELALIEPALRISIGCAQTGPDHYVSAEQLMNQADQQMYAQKRARKKPLDQPL